jgi:hypothetical protein
MSDFSSSNTISNIGFFDYGLHNRYFPGTAREEDPHANKTSISSFDSFDLKGKLLVIRKSSQISELQNDNYIIRNLKAKITKLSIHEKWLLEGIEEPTYLCRELAFEVTQLLYKRHGFYPERIGSSIENGILLHYINYTNNKTLSIEVYNDLEIAAIVNSNKTIEKAEDIYNFDFNEILQVYAS